MTNEAITRQHLIDYTKAIDLDPQLADAYYNRGKVYKKIGEKVKAAADFKQSAKLPSNF